MSKRAERAVEALIAEGFTVVQVYSPDETTRGNDADVKAVLFGESEHDLARACIRYLDAQGYRTTGRA